MYKRTSSSTGTRKVCLCRDYRVTPSPGRDPRGGQSHCRPGTARVVSCLRPRSTGEGVVLRWILKGKGSMRPRLVDGESEGSRDTPRGRG